MRLRYKFNLMVAGWVACGAFVMAIGHQLGLALTLIVLAYLNWECALAGEQKEDK